MQSGKLRHLVSIEEPKETQDETNGDITTTWVLLKKAYAEITPMSGREYLNSGALQTEIDTRIKIRFDDRISSKMRILYRKSIYNIKAPLPDAKSGREYVTFLCTSETNDG